MPSRLPHRFSGVLAVFAMFLAPMTLAHAARTPAVEGNDFSWPQCAKGDGNGLGAPMPSGHRLFMIVGLTNGTGFHENPCLAEQWSFARAHADHVTGYTVPTYPTRRQRADARVGHFGRCRTLACQLRNSGWAQGVFADASLRRIGARPPMVWVDVEVRHQQPWTSRPARNRLVIQALIASLRHEGYRVGVYSTWSMWRSIAGYSSRLPEWVPDESRATGGCRMPFSSGPVWLSQFTHYYRQRHAAFDENSLCRSAPALHRMFERAAAG